MVLEGRRWGGGGGEAKIVWEMESTQLRSKSLNEGRCIMGLGSTQKQVRKFTPAICGVPFITSLSIHKAWLNHASKPQNNYIIFQHFS